MKFSAWKIWWRPRAARRALSDYADEVARLDDEVGALREQISQKTLTFDEIQEKNRELAEKNDEFRKAIETLGAQVIRTRQEADMAAAELRELKTEHAKALDELAERKDAETQIREISNTLEQVEQMKQNYEMRIRRLRAEIVRLREFTGEGNPEADEIRQIDMRSSHHDDDWLISGFDNDK